MSSESEITISNKQSLQQLVVLITCGREPLNENKTKITRVLYQGRFIFIVIWMVWSRVSKVHRCLVFVNISCLALFSWVATIVPTESTALSNVCLFVLCTCLGLGKEQLCHAFLSVFVLVLMVLWLVWWWWWFVKTDVAVSVMVVGDGWCCVVHACSR